MVEVQLTSGGTQGYVQVTGLEITEASVVGEVHHEDVDRDDQRLSYVIVNNGDAIFDIDTSSIGTQGVSIIVKPLAAGSPSLLDYERTRKISLVVRSTDKGKNHAEGLVQINICDRNDPPVLSDAFLSVFENSEKGAYVGERLSYIDVDEEQKISFAIEDGNTPDSVIRDLAPATGFSGQGFHKDASWYHIQAWLLLGKWNLWCCNTGLKVVDSHGIGSDFETSIGRSWAPAAGQKLKGLSWKKYSSNNGIVNFRDKYSGGHVSAYAASYIYSDRDR